MYMYTVSYVHVCGFFQFLFFLLFFVIMHVLVDAVHVHVTYCILLVDLYIINLFYFIIITENSLVSSHSLAHYVPNIDTYNSTSVVAIATAATLV